MKSYINEIFTRTYNLEQKMGAGSAVGPSSDTTHDPALRSLLEAMQNDVRQIKVAQLGMVISHLTFDKYGNKQKIPSCNGSEVLLFRAESYARNTMFALMRFLRMLIIFISCPPNSFSNMFFFAL